MFCSSFSLDRDTSAESREVCRGSLESPPLWRVEVGLSGDVARFSSFVPARSSWNGKAWASGSEFGSLRL